MFRPTESARRKAALSLSVTLKVPPLSVSRMGKISLLNGVKIFTFRPSNPMKTRITRPGLDMKRKPTSQRRPLRPPVTSRRTLCIGSAESKFIVTYDLDAIRRAASAARVLATLGVRRKILASTLLTRLDRIKSPPFDETFNHLLGRIRDFCRQHPNSTGAIT